MLETAGSLKQKHFIDLSKGATPFVVLGCMFAYQAWDNPTAWAYLATHGTYGLLWVLKSQIFPDKNWEARCGIGYGMLILTGLALYWGTPWMICAWKIHAPLWFVSFCVSIFSVGVFLHFAADMQKDATLKLKRGLITDGLFARTRNPNYLGELLIYGGFSALSMHWYPFAVLGVFMVAVWIPNMLKKDKSISRHEGWDDYKANSGLLFPKLFRRSAGMGLFLFMLTGCASQVNPPKGFPSSPLTDGGFALQTDRGLVSPSDGGFVSDSGGADLGTFDGGATLDVAASGVDVTPVDGGVTPTASCGGDGLACAEGDDCFATWGSCGDLTEVGQCRFRDAVCDDHPDPVCGCDSQTYTNQCHARRAGVSIQHSGACNSLRCQPDEGLSRFCARQNRGAYCKVSDGRCDGEGYCGDRPQECHPDENAGPVCGCDGRTYDTLCDLRAAVAGLDRFGACRDRPQEPIP